MRRLSARHGRLVRHLPNGQSPGLELPGCRHCHGAHGATRDSMDGYIFLYNPLIFTVMRGLEFVLAFVGGAAAGAIAALLLAPEKGEDTRARICRYLKEKGISLKKEDLDELVDKIENNATLS